MSFDVTRAIFNQVDTNKDGSIDPNEFNQWAGSAGGFGAGGASSYESSSFSSGGYGAGAGLVGAGYGGASSYESSASYGAGAGLVGAGYGGASSYESSASYGAGAGALVGGASSYDAASSQFSSQTAVQQYATDAQGLFIDQNPQIIRRPAAGGVQTYTQNIKVRFLQPPPVPPPGVSNSSETL